MNRTRCSANAIEMKFQRLAFVIHSRNTLDSTVRCTHRMDKDKEEEEEKAEEKNENDYVLFDDKINDLLLLDSNQMKWLHLKWTGKTTIKRS